VIVAPIETVSAGEGPGNRPKTALFVNAVYRTMSRALLTIGLAVLLVLAGCSALGGGDAGTPTDAVPATGESPDTTTAPSVTARATATPSTSPTAPSPETEAGTETGTNERDRIGWENGYAYDDPIDVTPEDGLN
jgi:hypothetical protein